MSNTTRMNESCRAHSHVLYGMPPIRMYIPLIRMCDVTRIHVWDHWLVRICDTTYLLHDMTDAFTSVIGIPLIHMCDMTYSCAFICVTWLIHMCDMTQSYMWHDSIIRVTYLLFTCVIWRIHVFEIIDSFVHVIVAFVCVIWLTHSHAWSAYHSFTCVIWCVHMCDMADSWMVWWRIHVCDVTALYLRRYN